MIQETRFFGKKTLDVTRQLSFVGYNIIQTIYVFVYEKINQNKVMSGLTQYLKRKIFVLFPKRTEIAGLLPSKVVEGGGALEVYTLIYPIFKPTAPLNINFLKKLFYYESFLCL